MSRFTREDRIFRTERPFREGYQPPEIHERSDEIDQYVDALNPIIRGEPPKNIFLYGKTGVGKTAATHDVLDDLLDASKEYDDIDVSVFYVSCRDVSSSYQAATRIINTIREETGNDSRFPSTGYPRPEVFQQLFTELESVGGTVVLVLDEIDNIGSDDDLLYAIPRAKTNNELDSVEPCIVGISNEFQFKEQLSPEVKDSLCDEEIQFDPYNTTQLSNILQARVDEGLYDGVITDSAITLCSALAAKDTGSARQALRILHKAGEIVRDKTNKDKITDTHVRRAKSQLDTNRVKEGIRELTKQAQLSLCALLDLHLDGETPSRTATIYQRYKSVTSRTGSDTLVRRRMYDHLRSLNKTGLAVENRENDGANAGRYNEYDLDENLGVMDILDALEESTIPDKMIQDFKKRANNNH